MPTPNVPMHTRTTDTGVQLLTACYCGRNFRYAEQAAVLDGTAGFTCTAKGCVPVNVGSEKSTTIGP